MMIFLSLAVRKPAYIYIRDLCSVPLSFIYIGKNFPILNSVKFLVQDNTSTKNLMYVVIIICNHSHKQMAYYLSEGSPEANKSSGIKVMSNK